MLKQNPILFSTDMVEALLAGRKTQTRRIISASQSGLCTISKRRLDFQRMYENNPFGVKVSELENPDLCWRVAPKIIPQELLWVRETWRYSDFLGPDDENNGCIYLASENGREWAANDESWTWKPSIHMPKKHARIWLQCTEVRAERLQDITEEDCISEGIFFTDYGRLCGHDRGDTNAKGWQPVGDCPEPLESHRQAEGWSWRKTQNRLECSRSAKHAFACLIDLVNGEGTWESNPFVWVYSFRVVSTTGVLGLALTQVLDVMEFTEQQIQADDKARKRMLTAAQIVSSAMKICEEIKPQSLNPCEQLPNLEKTSNEA